MKHRLLQWLTCPRDHARFKLAEAKETNGEIESGSLICSQCHARFPIVRGVPRFVSSDNYASSFGEQWNRYAEVQLDSRNGTHYSRDRFYAINAWRPPTLNHQLVLDVGCGAGRFAEIALADGAEVVGVDLSSAVDAAYRNLGQHPRFHCLQASIYELPLADAVFDSSYCIGVIQHTPEPELAARSILPKVKIGGTIGFWIYELNWKAFVGTLGFKYLLRPITRGLDFGQIEKFSTALEKFFWPINRWGRQRGSFARFIMRMLPVSSAYLHSVPLSDRDFREWVKLDTIDMYSPKHDHPQTFATVKSWLEDAGFEVEPRRPQKGISITARRLR